MSDFASTVPGFDGIGRNTPDRPADRQHLANLLDRMPRDAGGNLDAERDVQAATHTLLGCPAEPAIVEHRGGYYLVTGQGREAHGVSVLPIPAGRLVSL